MALKLPYQQPVTIPVYPATAASPGLLASGRGRVLRISFRETTGAAAASFRLFDGSSPNGILAGTYNIASGDDQENRYTRGEFIFQGSLYMQLVSGTLEGLVVVQFLGPGQPYLDPMLAITLSDLAELEGTTLPAAVAAAGSPAGGATP